MIVLPIFIINLLNYNNSTWIDINTNNMKYTNTHIINYRNLLNT